MVSNVDTPTLLQTLAETEWDVEAEGFSNNDVVDD
jgi:hypothetical protein